MAFPRFTILFLFLLFFLSQSIGKEEEQEEEFSEELLLKPLPDRKVLAHFHFQSKVPPTETHGSHHRLFPKAIYQLVCFGFSFSWSMISYLIWHLLWRISINEVVFSLGLGFRSWFFGGFQRDEGYPRKNRWVVWTQSNLNSNINGLVDHWHYGLGCLIRV